MAIWEPGSHGQMCHGEEIDVYVYANVIQSRRVTSVLVMERVNVL